MTPTKPFLQPAADLIAYLETQGVRFDKMSKENASTVLNTQNYYYKLSRYKYNFPEHNGTYDVDFAYLIDFFEIDTTLRYYLLSLALDVEHAIKSTLLHDITSQATIDEYTVLNDFKASTNDYVTPIQKSLQQNDYLGQVYLDNPDTMPIWVFIECCSFSVLEKFLAFYQTRYASKRLQTAAKLLPFAKHIRNACAHNNVLLMNVYKKRNKLPISTMMKSYAHEYQLPAFVIEPQKLHDIFALVVLHRKYCSHVSTTRRHELNAVLLRFSQQEDYTKYPTIQKLFQSLAQILEKIG